MSLITGCPACGTMFRVVPDQLKISEGWVRCGHCSEVFDAAAQMQEDGALPAASPEAPDLAPQVIAAASLLNRPTAVEVDGPESQWPAPVRLEKPAVAHPPPAGTPDAWDSRAFAEPEPAAGDKTAGSVSRKGLPIEEHGYLSVDSVRREVEASRPAGNDPDDLASDDSAPLDDVSFLREARRKAFWRRPLVRAMLVVAFLVLAAVLGLQVVLHERDRIAATQPQWRPWIERLCQPLGCALAPPRRIDALVIDSSGFSKVRPDGYRLSFTLKNQAQQPVALPALELTLTDLQDQPVLRRVLQPRELGATADTIAPSSDWSGAVALTVDSPGSVGRIAGYRLLAFYP